MQANTQIYSVGTAWLTDKSGILHQTIQVDASGARVVPNNSRAAEFKDIKAFFVKKLQATNPGTCFITVSQNICNTRGGKKGTK